MEDVIQIELDVFWCVVWFACVVWLDVWFVCVVCVWFVYFFSNINTFKEHILNHSTSPF